MSLRRPRFEDEEPASAINISPLIDVIFILLIFFIVTMVFADNDAMGVDVPTPGSNAVNVAITYDGSVLLDGEIYGINSLKPALEARLSKSGGALVINSDATVPVKRLVEVMDCAKGCGAKEIFVATRKK